MKKLLILIFFGFLASKGFAQSKKFFLSKDDRITDSVKAKSYMLVFNKTESDSVYHMKQYSLEDLIIVSGSFKDDALSIPHGLYMYYQINREFKNGSFSKADNYKEDDSYKKPIAHYLSSKGKFLNGKMNGEWLHYAKNDTLKRVETFVNDVLDGPYKQFWENGRPMLSGNYKNGLREGTWIQDGGLYEITYEKGKVLSKNLNKVIQAQQEKEKRELEEKVREETRYYIQAKPKGDFKAELKKMMMQENSNKLVNEEAILSFIVKEDGTLSDPTITGLSDIKLMQKIKEFFKNAESWYPGTKGIDRKPTPNYIVYSLRYL